MKAPFSTKLLLPSEPLFGRDNMIRRFYAYAKGGDNIAFIGMRRVGKTSVIKRVVEMLSNIDDSNVCPIYVDVKNINEKGTVNFYCRLSAIVLSSLYDSGVLKEKLIYKTFEIPFFSEEIDIYDFLVNQKLNSPRIKEVFSFIVTNAFNKTHKTILLILDEYESVFKSIDSGEDINHLRNMSQNPVDSKTGLSVFSMWVVGAREWSYFISKYGSGEFNTCAPRKILPIDLQEFMEMWEYECEKIENEIDRERVAQYAEAAYQYSGGVPFFGKLIGSHILIEETYPSYDIFRSNFKEILGSLEIEEVEILKTLSRKPQFIEGSNFLTFLNSVGLVRSNAQGEYYIPMKFLEEYLQHENLAEEPQENLWDLFGNDIVEKIRRINDERQIKGLPFVFDPANDQTILYMRLMTQTNTEEQYTIFAMTLYLMIYEWTKKGKDNLANLNMLSPKLVSHDFVNFVGVNRHLHGSHSKDKYQVPPRQKTQKELYNEFLGKDRIPKSSEDYLSLQREFLKRFNKYLDLVLKVMANGDIEETYESKKVEPKIEEKVVNDEKLLETPHMKLELPKVVDKIDLPIDNKCRFPKAPNIDSGKLKAQADPERLNELHGKINYPFNKVFTENPSAVYTIDRFQGFRKGCSHQELKYEINDPVVFDLKKITTSKGEVYYNAIKIRPE